MAFIGEYWRGKGALWKVFWLYGVLLSTGLAAIIATAGLLGWVALPGLIAMLAGLAAYTGWILVSVWRCAENIKGVRLILNQVCGLGSPAGSLLLGQSM